MRYIIYIFVLFCFFSCNSYTCDYVELQDSYPKGAKKMDYEREIICILKFRNTGCDSIYLPFYRYLGFGKYKSHFCVKYKDKITDGPASFWGYETNTHVVAPGAFVRIGLVLEPCSLDSLNIKRDIEIKDLSKMISFFYQYNPADSVFSHIKTPLIEVKNKSNIKLTYNAH